ncbi:hypothetical protein [Marinobacterium aestuariivivens]|uniref:HAMP domain-containing protein n=1 Tax=Marinobacterium aestuariivivens TaxID=1698799 RepID=A0ABW1ZXL6_9GAMM
MNRRPTSIRRYLLQRTLLFSAIGFLLLLVVAGQAYNSSIRANAEQVARSVAQSTFNAMYLIMSQGWTRQQLEQFIGRLEEANDEEQLKVSIYRGPLVTELFGPIRQPALDTELQQVLGHGEVARHTADDNLRYLYPLRAEKTCQACHTNARIGDTLGVIEVQQDLKEQFRSANRTLLHYLLLLSPLPLLFAFWAVRKVTTRVNRSVEHLSNSIRQVESLSDLPQLALRDRDFGFRELNRIFTQVAQLSDKLRTIAVDKDLLEFEIRLLEKFVITSEVVRDWREYVQVLMQDISQVLKIYTMFSIFKVDDEMFDLEIFWHGQPTPETRQMMEDAVLKRLRDSNSPSASANSRSITTSPRRTTHLNWQRVRSSCRPSRCWSKPRRSAASSASASRPTSSRMLPVYWCWRASCRRC